MVNTSVKILVILQHLLSSYLIDLKINENYLLSSLSHRIPAFIINITELNNEKLPFKHLREYFHH
jgi:hypothetical protein